MPDYKLEIEIDVAKFTRDINRGLKDVNFGGGSGSGAGGTPKSPDISAQWDEFQKIMENFLRELEEQTKLLKELNTKTRRSQKTIEIIHRADMESIRLKHTLNSQYAILRASLIRDNMAFREMGGLFSNIGKMIGGRAGGGIGRLLDSRLKYMQKTPEIEEYQGPGFAGGKTAVTKGGAPNKPVFSSGKKGGIPQAVKIAGFAAGLAGAAGLGKLIIDSSPLLQAMFKIVNVGIMFMLRPIGDMFALLIRPVSIIFLKYAAGFYKDTLKYFPAWDKFGQAIASAVLGLGAVFTGDFGGAGEHFGDAGKAIQAGFMELDRIGVIEKMRADALLATSPGGKVVTVEERKEIQDTNRELKDAIKAFMKGEEVKGSGGSAITGGGAVAGLIGGIGLFGKATRNFDDSVNAFGEVIEGEEKKIELKETLKLIDSLDTLVTKHVNLVEAIGIQDKIKVNVIRGGETQQFLDILQNMRDQGFGARADQLALEKTMVGIETEIKVMGDIMGKNEDNNFANQFHATGGLAPNASMEQIELAYGGALENAEGAEDFLSAIADAFETMGSGDIKDMTEAMKRVNAEFISMQGDTTISSLAMSQGSAYILATVSKMRTALKSFIGSVEGGAEEHRAKEILRGIQDEGDCNIVTPEDPFPTKNAQGWPIVYPAGPVRHGWIASYAEQEYEERYAHLTATERDRLKANGARVFGFAKGGVINEPIFGRGLLSGRGYSFGERGPERITPISGTGGAGGGVIANFYISGVGGGDALELERKLKPAVMRWLKEEGSRRGIL